MTNETPSTAASDPATSDPATSDPSAPYGTVSSDPATSDPSAPYGTVSYPTRSPEELLAAQAETLSRPCRRYSLAARMLFRSMDLLYGKTGTLPKFRVLEIVARVPYQAWEHVAYIAITHTSETPEFARDIHDRVLGARSQQDNEQWHLLILEELLHLRGERSGLLRGRILPQLMAFFYYWTSWLLYAVSPKWSYRLNADFEDHAEHEYMKFVADHPELDDTPWETIFREEYGPLDTLGNLLRQIGTDEGVHRAESERLIDQARFR